MIPSLRSARRVAAAAARAVRDRIAFERESYRLLRAELRQHRELPGLSNDDIDALPDPELPAD